MINTLLLEEVIKNSGYRKGWIAEKMNISRPCLSDKINNIVEFKVSEVNNICDILNINQEVREKIFFRKQVHLKGTDE